MSDLATRIPECEHPNPWFSRSICACGQMHYYCSDCGGTQMDACDPTPLNNSKGPDHG